jgi:hypothetical protein
MDIDALRGDARSATASMPREVKSDNLAPSLHSCTQPRAHREHDLTWPLGPPPEG